MIEKVIGDRGFCCIYGETTLATWTTQVKLHYSRVWRSQCHSRWNKAVGPSVKAHWVVSVSVCLLSHTTPQITS